VFRRREQDRKHSKEGVDLKVAIVGCGSIGTLLSRAIDKGKVGKVALAWVYDIKPENSKALVEKLRSEPKIASGMSEIYADKSINLIIEAASQTAVRQYSLDAIKSGKDLMIMSVGALFDDKLRKEIISEAERKGRKIFIPSGAVLGIDGIKAAGMEKIREVILTTRKPPAALKYSKYLEDHNINLAGLRRPTLVFEGPAREAVKAFPATVNVAATLSLAGIGFDRTKVRIIADPKIKRNIHEVRVKSKSGELMTEARNLPFHETPSTSHLAALSAMRTLKNLSETIQVGT
jgi:aspartate dehydrogenase